MIKNKLIFNITGILTQCQLKSKTTIKLILKSNKVIKFFDFLWTHNIIYGYNLYNNETLIIYIKYSAWSNKIQIKQVKRNSKLNNLAKINFYNKNTFYLIKTVFGLLTVRCCLHLKIGGYILNKLF